MPEPANHPAGVNATTVAAMTIAIRSVFRGRSPTGLSTSRPAMSKPAMAKALTMSYPTRTQSPAMAPPSNAVQ